MKDAAGEANMTVVTIVLIAIVLGAGTLVVTNIVKGMKGNKQTECAQKGGAWDGTRCLDANGNEIKDKININGSQFDIIEDNPYE